MPSIFKGLRYLFTNRAQFCDSMVKNFFIFLPDKLYLSLRFRCQMGYWINWKNPQTFSEKIQWLKLYDRKAEYSSIVDKYSVKQYVADKIGEEYIIPTLGVWEHPEDIEWDKLPNEFVLKTTHGGGSSGVVICKDKNTLDKSAAIQILSRGLDSNIYKTLREWPYKNVHKRIIAEKFITSQKNKDGDLIDYKFFCFNGKPFYCQVISGRSFHSMAIDFYDRNWNHQPLHEPKIYPHSKFNNEKPKTFDDMWTLATVLSEGHPFLRVDFYEVDEKIYFGELTFYPTSGFGGFDPEEWDYKFGQLIKLPI